MRNYGDSIANATRAQESALAYIGLGSRAGEMGAELADIAKHTAPFHIECEGGAGRSLEWDMAA